MKIPAHLFVIAIFALIACSCSSIKVYTEKPNYYNPRYEHSDLKRNIVITDINDKTIFEYRLPHSDIVVIKSQKSSSPSLNDNKKTDSKIEEKSKPLGYLKDAAWYEYYYKVGDSLNHFVKNSLNSILCVNPDARRDDAIPVKVEINDFSVSDDPGYFTSETFFTCNLTFIYSDSTGEKSVKTSFKDSFSSGGNILPRIIYLIYDGVYDCAGQFVNEFDKSYPASKKISGRSTTDNSGAGGVKDSELPLYDYKHDMLYEYSLFFNKGEKITKTVGIGYKRYKNISDSHFLHTYGFDYSIATFKYNNMETSDGALHINYSLLWFPNKSHNGLFLSSEAVLILGNEILPDYRSNWFIGPLIKERVGWKYGPVGLKTGVYQLKLWGSELIKTDFGFFLDFSVYTY